MAEIEIKNLTVTYLTKDKQAITAIDDLSFIFPSGETSILMGENGCGKSTLLKAICCFFKFDGYIYVNGVDVESKPLSTFNISYVDQDFSLYPHFDVFENIAYPLKNLKISYNEIQKRVESIAENLNLSLLLSRKPKELSIGQQQRVALARALVKKPDILLMDEVFSNQDIPNQDKTREYLKNLIKMYNMTCIYITHSSDDALKMGGKIYTMTPEKIKLKK